MDLKKLGSIIRKKREEIGISPSILTEKVGIKRPTLWIIERGENPKTGKPSRPSKDKLEKIAEVLRMNQSETEELLALADYDSAKQPIQASTTQEAILSYPTTITESNGTVYFARGTYLEAFDARTGIRRWSSPLGISPLEDEVNGIIEALCGRISSGEFESSGKLPTIHKLAMDYQTTSENINTVLQALQMEGWIDHEMSVKMTRIPMSGLPKNPPDNIIDQKLQSVEEYIEEPKIFLAPIEIAKRMRILPEELIVRRFRTLGIPNITYRILDVYFPKYLVTDTMFEKMKDANYDVLPDIKSETGCYIKHIDEVVVARLPTEYEQGLLKIVSTNPVVDIKRICLDLDQKTVIMYNHSVLNANLFQLKYDYLVNHWG